MRFFLSSLLSLIYPPVCICGSSSEGLCSSCKDSIKFMKGRCGICANECGLSCGCIKGRFRFDGAFAVAIFEGVIKELIHRFKYDRELVWRRVLTDLLLSKYLELNLEVDYLVPVPMSKGKLRERGFNQVSYLAVGLSKLTNVPLYKGLVKIKTTEDQTRLTYTQRRRNLLGAFAVVDNKIEGAVVLLVDDVLTTGSTLDECAKVLKEHGAEKVYCLVVAKSQ